MFMLCHSKLINNMVNRFSQLQIARKKLWRAVTWACLNKELP